MSAKPSASKIVVGSGRARIVGSIRLAAAFIMTPMAEAMKSKTDGFIDHVDAAFVQQIFNIPQRKREANVHHDRKTDDFPAGPEVLEWFVFRHPETLGDRPTPLNRIPSDTAHLC